MIWLTLAKHESFTSKRLDVRRGRGHLAVRADGGLDARADAHVVAVLEIVLHLLVHRRVHGGHRR
jgi:hypothetical protein